MESDKVRTADIVTDPETGETLLVFPDGMLEEVGWKEGDVLEWIDNGDGTWTLRKDDTDETDGTDETV